MSFGWSAGDVATAIAVTYNLIQALDDTRGAAKDYREALAFLGDLKRVLEPLQAFTAWSAYPAYGREIGQQVDHIKGPVEDFLAAVLKYEPSLGQNARSGWQRRLPTTFRKLQWYIFMSKKVLSLRGEIELHMRILDSLMQRLTLDAVWTAQQKLPDALRTTFEETIRPELIALLRECLPQNPQEDHCTIQEAVIGKLSEHYQLISSDMEEMKKQIMRPEIMQQHIQSSLQSGNESAGQKALPGLPDSSSRADESPTRACTQRSSQLAVAPTMAINEESLSEVYFLVLLYLGHFLKNLFHVLSRLVQPLRALTPTLLAKYNISFLDAIGQPPRILPYEYFRSFKVLQAFIEHEFKDLPGSTWVNRGRYLILSLHSNQALNEANWCQSIAPGAVIAMPILLRKRLVFPINPREERCPESGCSGTWMKSKTQPWATCPDCQKEVIKTVLQSSNVTENPPQSRNSSNSSTSRQQEKSLCAAQSYDPQESKVELKYETDDEDISVFKRVAQETVDLGSLRNVPHSSLGEDVWRHLNGAYEELDPRYKIKLDSIDSRYKVRPDNERRFWIIGRVFKMLWTEPAQELVSRRHGISKGTHHSTEALNGEVYSEIRYFVVLQECYGSVICSPINTYSGQATLKQNLTDRQQHAIIYTSKQVPQEQRYIADDGTEVVENLSKDPIRVISELDGPEGALDPASRINYSKIYTVEIYVRVLNIGMVHKDDIANLRRNSPIYRNEPPERPNKLHDRHSKNKKANRR